MKKTINIISIGSDPEVLLQDKTTGKFISAVDKIPGDKWNPYFVSKEGHAIQVDNVAAEVCIPPSLNPDKTFDDIQFSLSKVEEHISNLDLRVAIVPSAEFEEDQLQDWQAREFGCDPDYNAYTGKKNPKPNADTLLRVAGAHVHIGIDKPTKTKVVKFAQVLDLFLAVPGVIKDPDNRRRELYGKAGAIRFPKHGLEYRTLSNFWIKNRESTHWLYRNIFAAADYINNGNKIPKEDTEKIISCINEGNQQLAQELIDKYKIEV